jgi:tetratricopeptide (TPR) repeat protein
MSDRIPKLKEMLLESPKDCFLWHALGLEHVKKDEIEQALEAFQQVINTDQSYVGTFYHLAKTYERLNDFTKAIEIYHKGIEIATSQKDMHARNELQMALDEIEDDE